MNEAGLKAGLVSEWRKRRGKYVVIRHEDRTTAGIPDISVTRKKTVAWIEVKYEHGSQSWPLTARQELMIGRLEGFVVTYHAGTLPSVEINEYEGKWFDHKIYPVGNWAEAHKRVVEHIVRARFEKGD